MSEVSGQIRRREERAVLFGLFGFLATWLIAAALITFKVLAGQTAGKGMPGAQIVLSVCAVSIIYLALRFAYKVPSWAGSPFVVTLLIVWLYGLYQLTEELNYIPADAQIAIPAVVFLACLFIKLMRKRDRAEPHHGEIR